MSVLRRPAAPLLVVVALLLGLLGAVGGASPAHAAGGTLSGTVTGTGGAGLADVQINLYPAAGGVLQTVTDSDGHYSFGALTAGSYRQWFVPSNTSSYLRQWWLGKQTYATADAFTITDEVATTNDITLVQGATISGHMYAADNTPLTGTVGIWDATAPSANGTSFVKYASVAPDGSYTIQAVPAGSYAVGFNSTSAFTGPGGGLPDSYPYVSQWYSDAYDFSTAAPVVIASESTHLTGIDAHLENPTFEDNADPTGAFYSYIQWMAAEGISLGTANPGHKPLYKPLDTVSRQAMAQFLYRLSGETFVPSGDTSFDDVPSDSQFYVAIEWMKSRGISTGTPNPPGKPLYKPSAPVTRQAMAQFLARYAGADTSVPPVTQSFADVPVDSAPAAAIEWMKTAGISTGTPNPPGLPLYKPADPVSRQAMAAFLYRLANPPAP